MPCPFFEPQRPVEHGNSAQGRLPLLFEHAGFCHAGEGSPFAAPSDMRFACNSGYSRNECAHFPAGATVSAFRYSVVRHSEQALELVCVEETGYAPIKWHSVRYVTATDALEPPIAAECMAAQALAFCHAYLRQSTRSHIDDE